MAQNLQSHTPSPDTLRMSHAARQLLTELQRHAVPDSQPHSDDSDKVYIPDTADSAYWAYEQLRNAVEYQEQHLLMRSAINRYLMRTFAELQTDQDTLGYQIIRELTKARYLTNETVSQSTLQTIDYRLTAYRQLYDAAFPSFKKDRQHFLQSLVGIISSDLQRILLPNKIQDALVNFAYHSYTGHLNPEDKPHTVTETTALYASVHRALLKSDTPTIHHYMFENQFPGWHSSHHHITTTASHLKTFFATVESATQGKRSYHISRMVRAHVAPYVILYHTLMESSQPENLLTQPDKLTAIAAQVAADQYKKARKRLRASVVRTIIFLLITKSMIGLAFEVPYEYFVLGELHYIPLIINLLFPPLYMLLLALTIKTPNFHNTEQIVRHLRAVLYSDGKLHYGLKKQKEKSEISSAFNVIYLLCSLAVMAGLGYVLNALEFSIVSGVIFFIFLSTVSFFGYRISQSVRELVVVEKRNAFDTLWSVVMTPFIRLGQWFSDRYSRFNIFMLILDFIIEAPYKTLLRVYEQWSAFLRDKQDDVLR